MSAFAGIYCRRAGDSVPDKVRDALRRIVSRGGLQQLEELARPGVFVTKIDVGAFGAPGMIADAEGLAVLAGEPLLLGDDRRTSRTRDSDLRELHEAWLRDDDSALVRVRGTFCAAHYRAEGHVLRLVVDKLGVRPLYYWADDRFVVFATSMRVLEQLDIVPKTMDTRAVTELAALGYPLAERTPYVNIRMMSAGTVLRASPGGIAETVYWRWDTIPDSHEPEAVLLDRAHDRFLEAVSARQRTDRTAVAFLSGGLDSRCIVGALREAGAEVLSFNFAVDGTQDQVFARLFADAIGAHHHELPVKAEVELRFSTMLAEALGASAHRTAWPPERERLVWSGDGGSVGTGFVYLTREMVAAARRGEYAGAADLFVRQQFAYAMPRILQPKAARALADAPRRGILEEMQRPTCTDAGRNLHVFLLLNDQRRHLARHFEEIDEHRMELQLPFFDSEFLRVMLEIPLDSGLLHGFYNTWLSRFAPALSSVPWQAYPGHVPCPIPVPDGLAYQWGKGSKDAVHRARKREVLTGFAESLGVAGYPSGLLRTGRLRIAEFLYRFSVSDYSYLLRYATAYAKYGARAGGRWQLPTWSN